MEMCRDISMEIKTKMTIMSKLKEKITRHFCIKTWNFWEKLGFYLVPKHFYYPIPDTNDLVKYNFNKEFSPNGICLDDSSMLCILQRIGAFKNEYAEIQAKNAYESNGDGSILY